MDWLKYWEHLCTKTPALQDDNTKMSLSVKQFRAAMKKAYSTGAYNERERDRAAKDFNKLGKHDMGPLGDFFSGLRK